MKALRCKNFLWIAGLFISRSNRCTDAFSFPKKTAKTKSPVVKIWNPPPTKPILRAGIAAVLSLALLVELSATPAWALTEQQSLVDDVWREVTRQYVDKTYNGMGEEGWRKERLKAVKQVSFVGPDEKEVVYGAIRNMLSTLGDPYTRFLTPEQFESLTAYAKGTSLKGGIGLQLMGDPATGKIVVLNAIQEGPAAKEGILPGDIILSVNEEDMEGATAEVVAAKCRGEMGSQVTLAIQHGGDGKPSAKIDRVSITRSNIQTKSVESSIFTTEKNKKIGLIKVASFNQETEQKVMEALKELRKPSALVLDLRGNPGGYMPAGVDVAKLFLPPQARVISEIDKSGRAKIYVNDGVGSDTSVPLYVLVDQRTASASEILTAALQDNHRATVVGGARTFGKGRIQNIQGPLEDGSGIAVTKAKYMTPDGRDINGVGIIPDVKTCGSNDLPATCLKGLL